VIRQLISMCLIVGLVAGMPALTHGEEGPRDEAREVLQEEAKTEEQSKDETSIVEDSAFTAASVVVSAGQVPLRAGTCAATAIVAGFAYLLTAFDSEAREGPGNAIARVCGGPYTTSPKDLRGD
jgi:hypothetical protein